MKPLAHLTIHVAWHDSQWNGAVCAQPGLNSFCVALPRIRESKRPEEDKLAGRTFEKLSPEELPPCKAESGFFMSQRPWVREFDHPYRQNDNCVETHGNMKKRRLTVPAGAAIAVPFNWMRRRNQKEIERRSPQSLPVDVPPPFRSTWVFGRARHEAVLDMVFGRLMFWKYLFRLHSDVELWCRRHFQKNALISWTFEPPEMYSTALS